MAESLDAFHLFRVCLSVEFVQSENMLLAFSYRPDETSLMPYLGFLRAVFSKGQLIASLFRLSTKSAYWAFTLMS